MQSSIVKQPTGGVHVDTPVYFQEPPVSSIRRRAIARDLFILFRPSLEKTLKQALAAVFLTPGTSFDVVSTFPCQVNQYTRKHVLTDKVARMLHDYGLLGCDAVQSGRCLPAVPPNIATPIFRVV